MFLLPLFQSKSSCKDTGKTHFHTLNVSHEDSLVMKNARYAPGCHDIDWSMKGLLH